MKKLSIFAVVIAAIGLFGFGASAKQITDIIQPDSACQCTTTCTPCFTSYCTPVCTTVCYGCN